MSEIEKHNQVIEELMNQIGSMSNEISELRSELDNHIEDFELFIGRLKSIFDSCISRNSIDYLMAVDILDGKVKPMTDSEKQEEFKKLFG